MQQKKFTVIGGDLRNLILANLLVKEYHKVEIFGFKNSSFDTELIEKQGIEEAIHNSDVVIGPLPCSNDNETLNAPFHPGRIYINDVFKQLKKSQIFLGGHISEKLLHLSEINNVYTIDYLKREEMAVLNAIPTSEGAIQIAMEELPITLHGCKSMILGFGRIGKTLAKMLTGLGCKVYVEARKYSDIAWIKNYGYIPVHIEQLEDYLNGMEVVFNTIPNIILDSKQLKNINKECLIIDLASKPGGVDLEQAKTMGLKTIWALSLPGKVAPLTAAQAIKETVYNILSELGV